MTRTNAVSGVLGTTDVATAGFVLTSIRPHLWTIFQTRTTLSGLVTYGALTVPDRLT